MGRSEPFRKQACVRFTERDFGRVEEQARRAQMPVAAWIRVQALRAVSTRRLDGSSPYMSEKPSHR